MRGVSKVSSQDFTRAELGAGWRRFSIYACINCRNTSSIGVGGIVRAGLYAGVALELINGGAEVPKSVLEELELLKQVDLLESTLVHL